jgi:hypothetical protein
VETALHDDLVDHAGQQPLELLQCLLLRGAEKGHPQLCEEVIGREGRGEVAFREVRNLVERTVRKVEGYGEDGVFCRSGGDPILIAARESRASDEGSTCSSGTHHLDRVRRSR